MNNKTDHPVHSIVASRWSPYIFDPEKTVSSADLHSLFEAARWTMSSYNAQPWRYIVGVKNRSQDIWDQVFEVLIEGNQSWAEKAPVLALGLIEHNFEYNGNPNKAALHDLGAASASLTYEATHRGITVHQMIGIEPEKARQQFDLPPSIEVVTGLAIGYTGVSSEEDSEFAKRDARPRERKPITEIILHGEL